MNDFKKLTAYTDETPVTASTGSVMNSSTTPERGKEERVDQLALGIEIVSAMKASLHNWDINEGRIDALMDTELDRIDLDGKKFEDLSEQDQKWVAASTTREKERLHKQAIFAASTVIEWFKQQGYTLTKS